MLDNTLARLFGSRNARVLKRLNRQVKEINRLEEKVKAMSDEELQSQLQLFRTRYKKGEELDSLLSESFAVVRETSHRSLEMRHFDVQLIGGIALHEGNIAEMRTGEGKTLMATLPAYFHSIEEKGTHIVTVNDYLAKRDAAWMGKLYRALGMTVGVIYGQQPREEKKEAYQADVTYGTNNEFGFDYLRDNLVLTQEQKMQKDLHYAIVDEVDSILIDEARTPLIISGARQDDVDIYRQINILIPPLKEQKMAEGDTIVEEGDFIVDEKNRNIELSERGHENVERALISRGLLQKGASLYDLQAIHLLHHIQAALKAHHLFKRDVHYLVRNQEIVIVDEHTGRAMVGRRWSEGIHPAIEAKESLKIQQESQTLASTTFQNYFRLYDLLAGMTGTADTEAYEFDQIYGLEVVVIPTDKPMIREDKNDLVFLTRKEKYEAIVKDIEECRKRNTPVLAGTASVHASEELSDYLNNKRIAHNVLNAKNHANEAEIIAEAGKPGTVTIATNMAGRGTDIVLGGNLEQELKSLGDDPPAEKVKKVKTEWMRRHDLVLDNGGLYVIGSERHESRRIDNQLRGRCGRQGDPGITRFYLSMEDDLLRLFASERVSNMMQALGLPEGEAIEHRMVTNAIERAQRKVEGRNFDMRKQLLEYDDVANNQRQIIYQQRKELLEAENMRDVIANNMKEEVRIAILQNLSNDNEEQNRKALEQQLKTSFNYETSLDHWDEKNLESWSDDLANKVYEAYCTQHSEIDEDALIGLEKQIMLQVLDMLWRQHLQMMDYLRQGIHLRGYAQRNPKEEYKKESYLAFEELLGRVKAETTRVLCHLHIKQDAPQQVAMKQESHQFDHKEVNSFQEEATTKNQGTFVRTERKIGRNEPCPCGSGKKYKHCHGRVNS